MHEFDEYPDEDYDEDYDMSYEYYNREEAITPELTKQFFSSLKDCLKVYSSKINNTSYTPCVFEKDLHLMYRGPYGEKYPIDTAEYWKVQRGLYFVTIEQKYSDFDSKVTLVSWNISEFPFCCGYTVMDGIQVWPEARCSGIATAVAKFSVHMARADGCGVLLATDVEGKFSRSLQKAGWERVHEMENPRTGNTVNMLAYTIDYE